MSKIDSHDKKPTAISNIAGSAPQQKKSEQVAEIPESGFEQQLAVQFEEEEIPKPPSRQPEPANAKPPEPIPDKTAILEPKSPEPATQQKEITNSIGMKFVPIQAGSFTMGSQISPEEVVRRYGGEEIWYENEQPLHPVKITKPFYL